MEDHGEVRRITEMDVGEVRRITTLIQHLPAIEGGVTSLNVLNGSIGIMGSLLESLAHLREAGVVSYDDQEGDILIRRTRVLRPRVVVHGLPRWNIQYCKRFVEKMVVAINRSSELGIWNQKSVTFHLSADLTVSGLGENVSILVKLPDYPWYLQRLDQELVNDLGLAAVDGIPGLKHLECRVERYTPNRGTYTFTRE